MYQKELFSNPFKELFSFVKTSISSQIWDIILFKNMYLVCRFYFIYNFYMNNLLKLNSISEIGKKVKINWDEIYLDSIAYFTITQWFFIKKRSLLSLKTEKH